MAKARYLVAIAYMGHTHSGREGDEFKEFVQSAVVEALNEDHAVTVLRDRYNLTRDALHAATATKIARSG